MARPILTMLAMATVLTTACDYRSGGFIGVTPPATKLVFIVQPSDVVPTAAIAPAVQVAIQNDNNQTITSTNAAITLSLVPGTGAAGATLSGASPQNAISGVATFSNLRVDFPGSGYQIIATASGFPSVASTAFNVTP